MEKRQAALIPSRQTANVTRREVSPEYDNGRAGPRAEPAWTTTIPPDASRKPRSLAGRLRTGADNTEVMPLCL